MERVLRIADGIVQRQIDARLRVVGERLIAEDREPLVDQVRHIEWIPGTHDPDELCRHYEWADALLLPSHWEGLPLSIVEAQLFGVVPVVADAGAVAEAVEHGRTGFLLPQRDVVREALRVLGALAKEPSKLASMSQGAHAAAMTRSWESSVSPLLSWLGRRLQ
jgi:glycosyltransferase involved in cell wall biosynthesis